MSRKNPKHLKRAELLKIWAALETPPGEPKPLTMAEAQKVWDAAVDRHTVAPGVVDIEAFNAEAADNYRKALSDAKKLQGRKP